jgi:hypothetical protein
MRRKTMGLRPSPALIVAIAALVAAVAGTAVAGPGATTSKITKKKVTNIARNVANQQIDDRAAGLSVAHANTATNATDANHATTANTANHANTATSAETAANAQALSGNTIVGEGELDGPGQVNNSTCTTVSEQLPGVQASDHVIATPPDAWTGITAEISFFGSIFGPTENVRYTICNLSGVNMNFGTSPPVRYLVIR